MGHADQPHELLLRHFATWAASKNREPDAGLVAELLRLRDVYDDLEPTYWPAGSVEHLLLERWPSKGAFDVPEPGVVAESLDAWFRFLRGTGRMSGRSADPKELTREARRSAERMVEHTGDRSRWSSTKVLMDFGRSLGIDFDDVPDVETMQQRLDRTSEAWNALPVSERRRLMPDPSGTGHPDVQEDVSDRERLVGDYGVEDPIDALVLSFADRLPEGDLAVPAVTGPQFERAPYVQQLLKFAAWAAPGQPVTDRDVLRLAPSREAYDLLGLDAWTREQLGRFHPDESLPGVAAMGRENWIEAEATKPWRSAADCDALDRLWFGGFAAGLLRLEGRKVVGEPGVPPDDQGWLLLGVAAVGGVLERLEIHGGRMPVIVQALLSSYVAERAWVQKADLAGFLQGWWSPERYREPGSLHIYASTVNAALGWLADTGIIEESADAVRLTEAGDVFVSWWLQMRERGGSS